MGWRVPAPPPSRSPGPLRQNLDEAQGAASAVQAMDRRGEQSNQPDAHTASERPTRRRESSPQGAQAGPGLAAAHASRTAPRRPVRRAASPALPGASRPRRTRHPTLEGPAPSRPARRRRRRFRGAPRTRAGRAGARAARRRAGCRSRCPARLATRSGAEGRRTPAGMPARAAGARVGSFTLSGTSATETFLSTRLTNGSSSHEGQGAGRAPPMHLPPPGSRSKRERGRASPRCRACRWSRCRRPGGSRPGGPTACAGC
jgi:hypothetical protein